MVTVTILKSCNPFYFIVSKNELLETSSVGYVLVDVPNDMRLDTFNITKLIKSDV